MRRSKADLKLNEIFIRAYVASFARTFNVKRSATALQRAVDELRAGRWDTQHAPSWFRATPKPKASA